MFHKVFQTKFGKEGNCFAACLASLMGDPIEDWQDVSNANPNWQQELESRTGLRCLEIKFEETKSLAMLDRDNELFILGVISENKLPHVVIGHIDSDLCRLNNKFMFRVIHDPLYEEVNMSRYPELTTICFLYKPFYK